jgi:hypothetical protein
LSKEQRRRPAIRGGMRLFRVPVSAGSRAVRPRRRHRLCLRLDCGPTSTSRRSRRSLNIQMISKKVAMKTPEKRTRRAKSDRTYHLLASLRAGGNPDTQTLRVIEERFCKELGYAEHRQGARASPAKLGSVSNASSQSVAVPEKLTAGNAARKSITKLE